MARPPRVNWEGAWYHVTDRGNERAAIFRDDEERSHLLEMLGRMSQRYQIRVHVYTWMDNHYHLIVETPEANLSAGMQWLNGGYGRWFNGRHGRHGHLWEGRFKAVVVEPERWGLEWSRYVHLNPVRVKRFGLDKGTRERHRRGTGREAGGELWEARVTWLRNYPWSSYRSYIGLEKPPEWLISRMQPIALHAQRNSKSGRGSATSGTGDILCLHDGWHRQLNADRTHTLAALEHWLPRWRDLGLGFVTMDEAVR